MKKRFVSAYIILSIIKNKKEEYMIMRDGGMLQVFQPETMDAQIILQYGIRLGYHLSEIEKRPVKVIDNFSKTTSCCSECGSIDVSIKAWQNFKTGSIEAISSDEEDNYCNTCEAHVTLEDKKVDSKKGIEILSIG